MDRTLAATSLSPSPFFARGPRRASAFSSWARSFIAARSSSVNPLTALPVTVALLVDFCVSVFGLIEPPHADFGWTPRRSANADPRYSNMRGLTGLRCKRELDDGAAHRRFPRVGSQPPKNSGGQSGSP